MGKLPRSEKIRKRKRRYKQDLDTQKTRHRCADTKYRSKVQYLYGKLEELLENKHTKPKKDKVLLNSMECIEALESEIETVAGIENIKQSKQEFLEFLIHEEAFWKKEKDLFKWWSRVQLLF